jgi:hypothetical protein
VCGAVVHLVHWLQLPFPGQPTDEDGEQADERARYRSVKTPASANAEYIRRSRDMLAERVRILMRALVRTHARLLPPALLLRPTPLH